MTSKARRAAKAKQRKESHRTDKRRREDSFLCADLFQRAIWALEDRQVNAATALLGRILRIRPHHAGANECLADLAFKARAFATCLDHYERLQQAPQWPLLTFQAALAAHALDDLSRAVTLLDTFLLVAERTYVEERKHARILKAEWARQLKRQQRATTKPASVAPVATDAPNGSSESNGSNASTGSTRVEPDVHAPEEEPLPAFPDLTLPPLPVAYDLVLDGFPATITGTDIGPIADVALRLAYADIRLQKGFDELLSLGHVQDLTHFRYQLETVKKILRDFRGRALLADEVGLGKTIEACLSLKEYWLRGLARKVLILTPPSLVSQWAGELTSRFGLSVAIADAGGHHRRDGAFWTREPLVVASLPLVRQTAYRDVLSTIAYDLVIVDEAHTLKHRTSAAWHLVNALKSRFLLLLSATPVGNDLSELYNLILLLRPGLLDTEAKFRRDYGHLAAEHDTARRDRLRGLLREVMVRNTRAHIDLPLPRRLAATEVVHAEAAEAAVLASLAALVRQRYANARGTDRFALTMLQMQAGSSPAALRQGLRSSAFPPSDTAPLLDALDRVGTPAKTQALLALIARSSGDKKIVFTRFRATLDDLGASLASHGHRVAVFHGGLDAAAKDAAIASFEHDAEVLLSSEIGGEGRNLQFCRTVINFDLPWNPTTIEQRVGRVHRIGQTRDVFVFNLCLHGSIEEHVLRILHDKINLFELVAGEMEMILGHVDPDQDFASLIMDLWAGCQSIDDERRAFDALSDRVVNARQAYDRVRALDRALFKEDFET